MSRAARKRLGGKGFVESYDQSGTLSWNAKSKVKAHDPGVTKTLQYSTVVRDHSS